MAEFSIDQRQEEASLSHRKERGQRRNSNLQQEREMKGKEVHTGSCWQSGHELRGGKAGWGGEKGW